MKSDKEYLDELHARIDKRLEEQKAATRRAAKLKRTVTSAAGLCIAAVITLTAWNGVTNSIRYKSSRPINNVGVISYKGNIGHDLSRAELINNSDVIIKATVLKVIGGRWSNPENVLGDDVTNIIDTYYLLAVEDIYKGSIPSNNQVIVSVTGGKIGSNEFVMTNYPKLNAGENVILFLSGTNVPAKLNFYPYKNSYRIFGFNHGVYYYVPKTESFKNAYSDEIKDISSLVSEIGSN